MNKKNQAAEDSPLKVGVKTLFLIRHAKSSWDSVFADDFDRPLNDRGKRDAPEMAKRLVKRKINIDAFVSSPAKRAKKTAEFFITQFRRREDEIIFISELYGASVKNFYNAIAQLNNKYNDVAIFSHNPGITEFANEIVEDASLDNMPTCSVFAVKINTKSWADFKQAKKEFCFFDYPKNSSLI